VDRKKKLYLNLARRMAHCFRCGFAARAEGFDAVARMYGFTVQPALHVDAAPPEPIAFPPHYSTAWESYYGRQAWEYLLARHVTPPQIVGYRLGFCPQGSYAQRIILPVFSRGLLRTWQARSLIGRLPKYITAPGSPPHQLFNLDRASKRRVLVLVEGVFDALRLPNYAVALLGKEWGPEKRAAILATNPARIFIALDRDGTADANSNDIAYDFRGLVPVDALPIHGKDLGEVRPADLAPLLAILRAAEVPPEPGAS
jgi:hypothetical protein